MRIHAGVVIASIVGSFLVYCGQSSTSPDGAVVRDAKADGTCCTATAPTFTKLAEGDAATGAPTNAIPVGAYREVVVYLPYGTLCTMEVGFRPDASTPFGTTGQDAGEGGARIRVDGTDLQLKSNCAVHYVVAGVQ
jgi:hypothetical protein